MIINKNQGFCIHFVTSKPFGSLLEISQKSHVFLKKLHSGSQEIKLSFTDQKSLPLEIEDKINLTLIIK